MAEQIAKNKPLYVVTDKSEKFLTENEALYLKNYRTTFQVNAEDGKGTFGVGTPNRSNKPVALITLPAGINRNKGVYECKRTNEFYFANWNSNGMHGWYVIDGYTMKPSIVIIDPLLNFSNNPENDIPHHRVDLTVVYEQGTSRNRKIKAKYLKWVDGENWQCHMDVIAAIATNGFDASKYSYWKLRPPHYDRQEYFQLPVRPPMFAPIPTQINPTSADANLPNLIINKQLQFAIKYIYTDGRPTTASPYSDIFFVTNSACSSNNSNVARGINLTLNVGSAMVERIQLYQRQCGGDWYLYDTIQRFAANGPDTDEYWLRTNDWDGYNYDPVNNVIVYPYYGDRQSGIIDQDDFQLFQNDIPLLSLSMAAAGDQLLLADNLYDYDNLPGSETSKFSLKLVENDQSGALVAMRKISVYAYVAYKAGGNSFLYTIGADAQIRFGGIDIIDLGTSKNHFSISKQNSDYFGANVYNSGTQAAPIGGFIAYLAGTEYYSIGQQYIVNPDGTMTKQGLIDSEDQLQLEFLLNLYNSGGYVIQKFDFVVPAGKYIVRLAKHNVQPTGSYQKTSTWVLGVADKKSIVNYTGIPNYNSSKLTTVAKEMVVDVCSGDYDSWLTGNESAFYVFVPVVITSGAYRMIDGYVYEDNVSNVPVEVLDYTKNNGTGSNYYWYGLYTDHNGFYFSFTAGSNSTPAEVVFNGRKNCGPYGQIAETAITAANSNHSGYYSEVVTLKAAFTGTYGDCNRVLIKGVVVDSNTGQGYSGVAITTSRGSTVFTGDDGSFVLAVHDTQNGRKDTIYINNGTGLCYLLPINGGNCFAPIPYSLAGLNCVNCTERDYLTVISVLATMLSGVGRSYKDGGKYNFAFHVADLAGRSTFDQEIGSADIPTFMELGGISLTSVNAVLNSDMNVGAAAKWLIFSRSNNLKAMKYIQWVGDMIEFLDKDGNVTDTGANAIRARITIQSLLDFNTQNNFTTNANYQFTPGDILRFYDDGNGNIFNTADTGGLLDFAILGTDFNDTVPGQTSTATVAGSTTTTVTTQDNNNNTKNGKTLIIPYDKRLLALNSISPTDSENITFGCGFWIEIYTPRQTSQTDGFCEIVGSYPIINGIVKAGTYPLNGYDTYYQNRNIHIALCTGKAILHPFASLNASDYFLSGCSNCGRLSVKNDLVKQLWYPKDVAPSDVFVNEGYINGLGRFLSSNRKEYKGNDLGGIVAMYAKSKLIAFICQDDYFVADYDNNFVQVGQNGTISATYNDELGEPGQKVRFKFGCAIRDISTVVIDENDGNIFWADIANNAIVLMDFNQAVNIASIDNNTYFNRKFKTVKEYNSNLSDADIPLKNFDIALGYDYLHKELHASFRKRFGLDPSPQYFTNTEREINYDLPETFTFSIEQKRWAQFQSFVGERYGSLRNAQTGTEFISFMNGIPYLHNSINNENYNEFFGVSDTQVIELVFINPEINANRETNKDLTWQATIIDSPVISYFIDTVRTNNPRLASYVPFAWFKRKQNIQYASLARNMASYPDAQHPVNSILADGGGKISGQWIKVRYVRDLNRMNEYSEVESFYMQYIGLEKSK